MSTAALHPGTAFGDGFRMLLEAAGSAAAAVPVAENDLLAGWLLEQAGLEAVPAVLSLPASAGRPTVRPLDDRGQRQAAIAVRQADGAGFRIDLGPPSRTVWYEIEFAAGL